MHTCVGSSPCRWKLWDETKIHWNENCSELGRKRSSLQGAAAALPWQRWREHVLESESQGYSISSCFNNTTPLWKEYYIPCKYDENTYQIFGDMENLPSRLRQGNELHILLVSLTMSRVDEAWFQTIIWAYYFWLGLFKWDKIGQKHRCVSSLE